MLVPLPRAPSQRVAALSVAVALVALGCTDDERPRRTDEAIPRGGRLVVSLGGSIEDTTLDPQRDYFYPAWEVFRCCLLRTLLSYNGRPTKDGGSVLRPDLAQDLPEVSADGLTWTFRLKQGLTYAPPFEDVEITSADIVRALVRESKVGSYAFYYTVIDGFTDAMEGRSDSISGLETPDERTLIVHLTEPTGDLGYRLSLPAAAPIPPDPGGHPLGAAGSHSAYGRYLVSSGPYMVEGSDALDFARPPEAQEPLSGLEPGRSVTLVRNPSWQRETDPLRPAYVDEMHFELVGTPGKAARSVIRGEADVAAYSTSPPQVPLNVIERFRSDPELRDNVFLGARDNIRYISLNLAIPPLDDIHVRKAINYAIDKARLLELRGGPAIGEPAGHISPDSTENNLLLNYDPYGSHGNVDAARAEMARSKYDHDHDGRCDSHACRDLQTLVYAFVPPSGRFARIVAENLSRVGIHLDVEMEENEIFDRVADPETKIPIAVNLGWLKDFPSGSNFIELLFSRAAIGGQNSSLVGATPPQLRRWGYDVRSVPSIEDKISECHEQIGEAAFRCWAEADQLLMEKVVPWVPLVFERQAHIVSSRVVKYSFDQFAILPAFDRFAVSKPAE